MLFTKVAIRLADGVRRRNPRSLEAVRHGEHEKQHINRILTHNQDADDAEKRRRIDVISRGEQRCQGWRKEKMKPLQVKRRGTYIRSSKLALGPEEKGLAQKKR
jgi:hypothetical protein